MFIDPKMQKRLSFMMQNSVSQLPERQQELFWTQFASQSKNPTTMTLLAIFFPIHFFLLGKIGMGIAYYITGGGLGIWYIVELFLASGRAIAYNDELAQRILMMVKMSTSSPAAAQ